ncbi:ABC-2 type transporter [Xylanimonas cellulosilytica DSM 15894]|uniref:Transport permease protein n=1 Tax=Xylanimonas cellulosilytica (strain DSM 15894 / JCM 12276 / CECT 5975 / KCTC 9989 / LMG 20990 / NBRC 107835 / XIL07) TaxID=446471 RepID=D1BWR5_XYLCX|nr:ABC transporter permease [Xylanimonas cellulosilytica]ACZ29647.1 ABC-2 type transporter [Xylanimonas cellulosilytica DSM 15894]
MTTVTAPARLPGVLPLAVVRAGVELRGFLRERDAVIFILAYPVVMFAIFASVFGGENQAGMTSTGEVSVDFARYFLPGMVATGLMLTSFQSLAISVALERDDGTLKRLRATPVPASAYVLGKVLQILAVSVVQVGALLALARFGFDVPLPATASAWATFAWVFLLATASGVVLGIAFSALPRSARSASAVVTSVVLVLQFISGVFFPFYGLPSWMQQVASLFPLKWTAQGMRSVFLPDEARYLEVAESWQHGLTAAILAAWLVVGLVVGVRTFRWRRRDDG